MDIILGAVAAVSGVLLVAGLLKIYSKLSAGVCRSKRSMQGKTVIVTGANSGIGLETARELAKRNARVILACRNMDKAQAAARDIMQSTGNEDIIVRQLNLASLESVKKFAQEILDTESRLDVLVHNAGRSGPRGKHLTKENLEVQFATNHFGPFLLNHLLLDLMKKSAPSRIVVVSSLMHIIGRLDLENLNMEKYGRSPFWVYASTKLANILFTKELSRKLEGTGVTVNALHPGAVQTAIARNAGWLMRYIMIPIFYFYLKSPNLGAQTSVYLAVSKDVEDVTGEYFIDCHRAWTSPSANNKVLAKRLWEISEKMTGITTMNGTGNGISNGVTVNSLTNGTSKSLTNGTAKILTNGTKKRITNGLKLKI